MKRVGRGGSGGGKQGKGVREGGGGGLVEGSKRIEDGWRRAGDWLGMMGAGGRGDDQAC